MTIMIIVSAQDEDGDVVGIGAEVPLAWQDDPTYVEDLCFGALTMFQMHVRKQGIKLPFAAPVNFHFEER